MDLALRIKRAREAAGLSQRRLAKLIGVSAGAVGQWEAGTKFPTRANLLAVADATVTPIAYFFASDSNGEEPVTIVAPAEVRLVRGFRLLAPVVRQNVLDLVGMQLDVARKKHEKRDPAKV